MPGYRQNNRKAGVRHVSRKLTLPGDHDGSTRTAHFWEIPARCHPNLKPGAFPAHNRTVVIRFSQCALQAPPSCTSAVASFAELAGIASLWKRPCLLERC